MRVRVLSNFPIDADVFHLTGKINSFHGVEGTVVGGDDKFVYVDLDTGDKKYPFYKEELVEL